MLLQQLKQALIEEGAAVVSCGDLQKIPASQRHNMPIGICIGVVLNPSVVEGIKNGPTLAYANEYDSVNTKLQRLADDCADFLQKNHFQAIAAEATVKVLNKSLSMPLPHKTVGTLAGVGWIGKCALLINETYGSAIRYISVLTDAVLPPAKPITESKCGKCKACIDICPAHAPKGKEWYAGLKREEFYDAYACNDMACDLAASKGIDLVICGMCIAACPYTKKYIANNRENQVQATETS